MIEQATFIYRDARTAPWPYIYAVARRILFATHVHPPGVGPAVLENGAV